MILLSNVRGISVPRRWTASAVLLLASSLAGCAQIADSSTQCPLDSAPFVFAPLEPDEGSLEVASLSFSKIALFTSARLAALTDIPEETTGGLSESCVIRMQNERAAALVTNVVPRLYEEFALDVDVVVILVDLPSNPDLQVRGAMLAVAAGPPGIGTLTPALPQLAGLSSRLKGVLILYHYQGLSGGPFLHEFAHLFANHLGGPLGDNAPYQTHWGFNDVGGQLGGWAKGTLVELGDGVYRAEGPNGGRFNPIANGGNSIPYAPLELYLMGLLPAAEVPPIEQALDPVVIQDGDEGTEFAASGFRTVTIDDIIRDNGSRNAGEDSGGGSDGETGQTAFSAACLVIRDSVWDDAFNIPFGAQVFFMEAPDRGLEQLSTEWAAALTGVDASDLSEEVKTAALADFVQSIHGIPAADLPEDFQLFNFAAATGSRATLEFVTLEAVTLP